MFIRFGFNRVLLDATLACAIDFLPCNDLATRWHELFRRG